MSLIGKVVEIHTKDRKFTPKTFYEGKVTIVDKVLMDKAGYSMSAVMNNASIDVFMGIDDDNEMVLFLPQEILQVITK
jgi:hypothetical protein